VSKESLKKMMSDLFAELDKHPFPEPEPGCFAVQEGDLVFICRPDGTTKISMLRGDYDALREYSKRLDYVPPGEPGTFDDLPNGQG
jgi:hypothetical protein